MTDRPKCDKCDRDETMAARDLIETRNDTEWATFEALSAWRYGCYEHYPKPSRTYFLSDSDYPVRENI